MEVQRASAWLIQEKQLTNAIELGSISITHTLLRSRPASADGEAAAFTNGWIATLGFYEPRCSPPLPQGASSANASGWHLRHRKTKAEDPSRGGHISAAKYYPSNNGINPGGLQCQPSTSRTDAKGKPVRASPAC
jgi:hypothetical protein